VGEKWLWGGEKVEERVRGSGLKVDEQLG